MQMDDTSPFTHIDENFFERAIIERLCLKMGYKHLFGPDVKRTDDGYRDVFGGVDHGCPLGFLGTYVIH